MLCALRSYPLRAPELSSVRSGAMLCLRLNGPFPAPEASFGGTAGQGWKCLADANRLRDTRLRISVIFPSFRRKMLPVQKNEISRHALSGLFPTKKPPGALRDFRRLAPAASVFRRGTADAALIFPVCSRTYSTSCPTGRSCHCGRRASPAAAFPYRRSRR